MFWYRTMTNIKNGCYVLRILEYASPEILYESNDGLSETEAKKLVQKSKEADVELGDFLDDGQSAIAEYKKYMENVTYIIVRALPIQ